MAVYKEEASETATSNESPRPWVYQVLYFLKKLQNAISLDYTCRNGFLFTLIFILSLRKQGKLKYKQQISWRKLEVCQIILPFAIQMFYFSCTLKLFFVWLTLRQPYQNLGKRYDCRDNPAKIWARTEKHNKIWCSSRFHSPSFSTDIYYLNSYWQQHLHFLARCILVPGVLLVTQFVRNKGGGRLKQWL